MAADHYEERAKEFMGSLGFTCERFTKEEMRKGRTPDFRVCLILHGVAFYQLAREGSVRKIRCHGPDGIYRHVREEMGRLSQKP
jgi:hypothetical protein